MKRTFLLEIETPALGKITPEEVQQCLASAAWGWPKGNPKVFDISDQAKVPQDTKLWNFSVQTSKRSQFPLDMLRRDICWPSRENEDVPGIYRSILYSASDQTAFESAPIHLTGLTTPYTARWRSFGWDVLEVAKVR